MIRTVRARRAGGGRFVITTGSGHTLAIDNSVGDSAPRPVELLLAGQAGCTALDVASIMAKKRQWFSSYVVNVTGEQRDDRHPHVFQRIDIVHEFDGPELDVTAVHRAIELSATRYCTASATFSAGPTEVHHRYTIRRGQGLPIDDGEVVVTGPYEDPDALGGASRSDRQSLPSLPLLPCRA